MSDLHRTAFIEEAHEILGQLEIDLLELEGSPENSDLIGTVFRHMHTLKGSSAMFGYNAVSDFAHQVETVLDQVRDGRLAVTRELIDLILRARDLIRLMLEDADDTGSIDPAAGAEILAALQELAAEPPHSAPQLAPTPALPPQPSAGASVTYRIRFIPAADIFLCGTNPVCLFNELRSLGELILRADTDRIPALEKIDAESCYTGWDILLHSAAPLETVREVFLFVEDEGELSIKIVPEEGSVDQPPLGEILVDRGDLSPQALKEQLGRQKKLGEMLVESGLVTPRRVDSALAEQRMVKTLREKRQQTEQQSTIRVPAERLDHMVNLVGEQVTIQARLNQLAQQLKNPELTAVAEEVTRLTTDLRDSTLNIRMLPIGATFAKFRRLIRDLSGELGKEIVLTTDGEETELDKTVIEKLNDPLVHMIRNCIDHAIETPEARLAKGKPAQGTIHLAARHSGDSVTITIADDGAGLDRQAILAKGIERGLVAPQTELSEEEIFALIFAPGFSTAQAVTSISGRGVGMDVVKQSLEELRGSIDVHSEYGRGTTFTVRIPLTLAIIESLLVRVGGDHYMVPLALVEECMFLTAQDVERTHGRQMVNIRDRLVPYIRLREQFAADGSPPAMEQLVIASFDGKFVGFAVDAIVGQYQTVIKSLGKAYKNVEGIAGATILGDGSVALILDVPKLYQTAARESSAA